MSKQPASTRKMLAVNLTKLRSILPDAYGTLRNTTGDYLAVAGALADLDQCLTAMIALEKYYNPGGEYDSAVCTALSVHGVIAYYRAFDSTHTKRKRLGERVPFNEVQREKHDSMMKLRKSAVAHPDERPKGFYAPFWREQTAVIRVVDDRALLSLIDRQSELVSDVVLDLIELIDVASKFLREELEASVDPVLMAFQAAANDPTFLPYIIDSLFKPADYFDGDLEKINAFWFDPNPTYGRLDRFTPYTDETPEALKAERDHFNR